MTEIKHHNDLTSINRWKVFLRFGEGNLSVDDMGIQASAGASGQQTLLLYLVAL